MKFGSFQLSISDQCLELYNYSERIFGLNNLHRLRSEFIWKLGFVLNFLCSWIRWCLPFKRLQVIWTFPRHRNHSFRYQLTVIYDARRWALNSNQSGISISIILLIHFNSYEHRDPFRKNCKSKVSRVYCRNSCLVQLIKLINVKTEI